MSLTWFLHLLSLGVILNGGICAETVTECNPTFTWFGTPCRYKCHCTNNSCDSNGECTQSSVCENGWFGASCQYADLVSANNQPPTPAWVYDFPDTLCNPGQETVTVSLTDIFYFTWLRLRANAPVRSQDFNIQLMYVNGNTGECSNLYTSRINDTILDIHCQPGTFFQNLRITGDGVRSLCSVYISGGRNVALGQVTLPISNYSSYLLQLAVDGNSCSFLEHGNYSHTLFDSQPSWTLTFERPHHINRYLIYNRNKTLWTFIMEAYQDNRCLAVNYTAPTNTNLDIYRIQSMAPHTPVSEVNIIATYSHGDGEFETQFEMDMFGDVVCPALKYGRECEKTCNCAKDGENCFVSTGGCPSGCAAGYQGEGCRNPCGKTHFGVHCSQKCSYNCVDQDCQPTNGACLSCIPGKKGPMCNIDCSYVFWGNNCNNLCSSNCENRRCNPINGLCISCVAGKYGDDCSKDCNPHYWGENCNKPCSSNCENQLCNAINGLCISCVAGKYGDDCSKDITCNTAFTWFGKPCRYKCHCTKNSCDSNGECIEPSVCENGWFGPSCQYADLVTAYTTPSTPAWVYDFPDTLCNPGQETVTVSLYDIFYFTWLRLGAKAPVASQDFTLQLMYANGSAVECSNIYISRINDTILDMHCQPGAFFQNLIITGDGVKSLCSVYISGGRNVALGQSTVQSSVYGSFFSWLAVDGDTYSDFEHGRCSVTHNDNSPYWTLTFKRSHHVNRYVLYKRNIPDTIVKQTHSQESGQAYQRRLSGFILAAYQNIKSPAFIYTDVTNRIVDIYSIQSTTPHIPVSKVKIMATHAYVGGGYLGMCEVEMFGDTVCPAAKFGRECEKTCNCALEGENCFVSTGGCPSGCAAGYQGEGCRYLLPERDDKPIAMISGLVFVAFLVLVTVIAIAVFIWRKSRHNIGEHERTTSHELQNFTETDNSRKRESEAGTTTPHEVVSDRQCIQKVPKKRSAATATAQGFQYQDNESIAYITPYNAYETTVGSSSLIGTSQELEAQQHGTYSEETSTNLYASTDDRLPNPYESTDDHQPNLYETIDETESGHYDYISDI